jgi:hypothetical protein
MKARTMEEKRERRLTIALWFLMLGAPVAWLMYLQTAYLLVLYACSTNRHYAMHLGAAAFLGVVLMVGFHSHKQWRAAGALWPKPTDEGFSSRHRMLSMMGLLQAGFFALIIITSWVAMFILHPCQK